MGRNVRCGGRQEVTDDNPVPGVRKTQYYRPCGWTAYDLAATPTRLDSLRDEAVAATGTCPNCGGHLEPIPTKAGLERKEDASKPGP